MNIKGILFLTIFPMLIFLNACTTCEVDYNPENPPVYSGEPVSIPIKVRNISVNRRSLGGRTYYVQFWNKAKFSKDIDSLLRNALETEIRRFGLAVIGTNETSNIPHKVMDCSILDFQATHVQGTWSSTANLLVSVKFKLIDPLTDKIETENIRTVSKSVELSSNAAPNIISGGGPIIRGYGHQLVNTLLPNAISQEINSNKFFHNLVESTDKESLVIDRISLALLADFEFRIDDLTQNTINIGVSDVKNDENGYFRSIIISSFMEYWKPPRYSVITRDKIDTIIKEWEQRSRDIFDSSNIEIGALKGVDYLVAGGLSEKSGKDRVEIQIIRVVDGEIIASKSKDITQN